MIRLRLPITAPKGRKAIAQGSALGERRERGQALKGRDKDSGHRALGAAGFRPFRAREFWGLGTQGAAALCPGLSHPGLSGLKQGALFVAQGLDGIELRRFARRVKPEKDPNQRAKAKGHED